MREVSVTKDVAELTVSSDLDLRRLDYEGGEGMLVSCLLTEAKVTCGERRICGKVGVRRDVDGGE